MTSSLDRARATLRLALSARVLRAARRLHHLPLLALAYPPTADPVPRFGHGRPWQPQLAAQLEALIPAIRAELESFVPFLPALDSVPGTSEKVLRWNQDWIPALDGVAIYSYLRLREPATYIEVGSGTSTAFAAHARSTGSLSTTFVSIDPEPRADVEALCDVICRKPFELSTQVMLDAVHEGDIIFFDGSHQAFTNSDAVCFFLEVLPLLPPNVLVGIHDIFLPADYPPSWAERYFAEQYLLATFLLGGGRGIATRLPAHYAGEHESLAPVVRQLTSAALAKGATAGGQAFWFETVAEPRG